MSELNIREIAEKITDFAWPEGLDICDRIELQALAADWLRRAALLGGKFAEIEAREKAATKAPWSVDAYKTGTSTDKGDKYAWVSRSNGTPVFGTAGRALICDAEFTGHARTDIPALLQEVRNLTAAREADATKLKRLRDELERARHERNVADADLLRQKDNRIAELAAAHEADRQDQLESDARISNQREEIKWYASEVATLQNRLNIYSSWREADRQEIERLKVAESFAWNTGHAKLIDLAAQKDAEIAGLRDALTAAKAQLSIGRRYLPSHGSFGEEGISDYQTAQKVVDQAESRAARCGARQPGSNI